MSQDVVTKPPTGLGVNLSRSKLAWILTKKLQVQNLFSEEIFSRIKSLIQENEIRQKSMDLFAEMIKFEFEQHKSLETVSV